MDSRMDHDILLNRLEKSFGFFGMAIGWIRSYLTGRRQYVRYSGSMSTVTPTLFGVPQGSVLGPLFFVLYTADVFRIAEELDFSIYGYADDLQIYDHCLVRDTVQHNGRLVHCIDCMGQRMLMNRFKLNASKPEFIWLGSPRRLAACSFDWIVVDGSVIQSSLTVRDLGVIIDPAISLVDHVNRLTRTCYFLIRQLRSIRRSLTTDFCHTLVRAMVLSRLDYCNGLLGRAPKYLLGQLSGVMRGRRAPYPRASSERPQDWRDLRETALARHFRTSRLQTLCAGFLVSARVCTSVSIRLLHPGWCNWRTVKFTINGFRPVVCSTQQDCDNRPTGIHS